MTKRDPVAALAAADRAHTRCEFTLLAHRAELAGMRSRNVRAIRSAFDLFEMLTTPAEMRGYLDRLANIVAGAEQERDLRQKARE